MACGNYKIGDNIQVCVFHLYLSLYHHLTPYLCRIYEDYLLDRVSLLCCFCKILPSCSLLGCLCFYVLPQNISTFSLAIPHSDETYLLDRVLFFCCFSKILLSSSLVVWYFSSRILLGVCLF